MSKFRRQLMAASMGKPVPPLPYDAEVEYLEANGTQYIDTGYCPKNTTKIVAKGCYIFPYMDNSAAMHFLFGCRDTSVGVYFDYLWNYYETQGLWYENYIHFNNTTGAIYTENQRNDDIVVELSASGGYVNGVKKLNVTASTFTTSYSLYLLWCNDNGVGQANRPPYGRIYSCQIYESDVLIHDFIPVRVGQIGYMYDRVGGQLYGNAGSGSFVVGLDKQSTLPYDAQVEYLGSSGAQYIDTLIDFYYKRNDVTLFVNCKFDNNGRQLHGSNGLGYLGVNASNKYEGGGATSTISRDSNYHKICLHTIVNSNAKIDIDTTTLKGGTFSGNDVPYRAFLYALGGKNDAAAQLFCKAYLKSAVIYLGNEIVRDYMPVRVGQVGYLYDRISGQLFGNSGTGAFTYGNDVV